MALTKIPSELSSTTGIVDNSNATAITIDSSENVGIGTSSPQSDGNTTNLEVSSAFGARVLIANTDTNGRKYGFYSSNSGILGLADYTASGTPTRMAIDSSGNVGIGTTSPDTLIHLSANTGATLTLESTDTAIATNEAIGTIDFFSNDASGIGAASRGSISLIAQDAAGAGSMLFKTSNASSASTERMRIDSSGNVGIGTTSPSGSFVVSSSGAEGVEFFPNSFTNGNTIQHYDRSSSVYSSVKNIAADHRFNIGSTERVRIDSNGNLLVGKSATGFSNVGFEARASGTAYITASGAQPLVLNRKSSDGSIVSFYKDGTTVGSIGTINGDMYLGTGNVNLRFTDSVNDIRPVNSSGLNLDNTIDLGASGTRFDDIYATNGTIQTSDRNEKQDIAELSDAEQRVAVAAKGLLRKFRWKDSVAEKGDDARIHFGIIAQDLQAAFVAEGLDAGDYAMFISTTWTDEETNEEKTRMGVRYSELLAFIISAI